VKRKKIKDQIFRLLGNQAIKWKKIKFLPINSERFSRGGEKMSKNA
jgi:hypothetical protein